ncbi:MAG: flagellar basal body P-ring protein FlgI [Acidimicrobiales bacterium]|nr:flagellar basal body P-ring protein FlgI [Hyphomonadaceae bacterium]RZV42885.1 MAG: flagellar basal body P-ring protein FlgI [Acidimicrobiales bacterium]
MKFGKYCLQICFVFFGLFFGLLGTATAEVKIKDLVDVEGVRGNDLVGYGLVIGLDGSGDTIRNSPYTEEALSNLLERLGVNIQGSDFRPNNVAAVLVTATLPPFSRSGSRIDVNVSSIGDAKSLSGGTLVMTPLNAADGEVYGVAQGSVLISGFEAEGDAASIKQGVPTAGTIPNGARIEREVNFEFGKMKSIRLALRSPDFTTAERIETAINTAMGSKIAELLDSGTVELNLSSVSQSPARLISKIENIDLVPAQKARVVIDQRSGTIVLGQNVKVSSVAIAQGNLSIKIAEAPVVSQPNPFGGGQSIILPRTNVEVQDGEPGNIALVESNVTLPDLVAGLNALGVSPREMIDILKTMKTAGALHAELVLQ